MFSRSALSPEAGRHEPAIDSLVGTDIQGPDRMKLAHFVACAAALVAAGCASANLAAVDPPPPNYRQLAQQHVRENFFDPYSIRDAQIAAPRPSGGPILVSTGLTEVWVVSVRANAKNQMGAYTGQKATAIMMQGNRVVGSQNNAMWGGWCSGSQYEPFPEIMQSA